MSQIIKPPIPRINWSHPLTRGLVFDAPFFEGAGNVLDIVQRQLGSLSVATWDNNIYGKGIDFSGANSVVSYSAVPLFQQSLSIVSIEFLTYYRATGGGGLGRVIHKGNGTNGYFQVNTGHSAGNQLSFQTTRVTTSGIWDYNSSLPTNGYAHFVMTYDGSGNNVTNDPVTFINGLLKAHDAKITPNGNLIADDATLYIGNRSNLVRNWDGKILWMRLWNRILSPKEAVSLYANPFAYYYNRKNVFGNSAANAYTQTLTEQITIVDVIAKQNGRTLVEVMTIVDTLIKKNGRTFTEAITIADTLLKTGGKNLLETVTVVDAVIKGPSRTMTETVTIVDTVLKTSGRILTETITIVDTLLHAPARILTETITIVDTVIRNPGKLLAETVTVVDIVIKTPLKLLTESISINDTLIKLGSKVLTESITITDAVIRTPAKLLTETITVVDTVIRNPQRILTESITIVDTVVRTTAKVLTETITITDNLLAQAVRNFTLTLTETITIVDTLLTRIKWYRRVSRLFKSARNNNWFTRKNTDWEDK